MEELEHLHRGGCRADVDRLHLVEPEHRAQAGEDLGVRPRHLLGERGRHLFAALLQAHLRHGRVERSLHRRALLLGLAGDHRLQARLQLLPYARDREEPARPHFGQVGEDLARVIAAGDLQAEDDRQVVVGVALGHVRRRQPRDHAAVARELDQLIEALDCRQQVAVDQLHALRRPGRAGGVDQRQHVGRLDLRRSRPRRRSPGSSPRPRPARACPPAPRRRRRSRARARAAPRAPRSTRGRYCCSQIRILASASATR